MVYEQCGMMHGAFGMPGAGLWWIYQLLIFVVFFLIVWWLIKNNPFGLNGKSKAGEKPIDILKKRLASGEISKKEFDELKKEIEK